MEEVAFLRFRCDVTPLMGHSVRSAMAFLYRGSADDAITVEIMTHKMLFCIIVLPAKIPTARQIGT